MTTRRDYLNDLVKRAGLQVHTHSPGDGITRYRFFTSDPKWSMFHSGFGIATTLGLGSAIDWVEAYIAGQESSNG